MSPTAYPCTAFVVIVARFEVIATFETYALVGLVPISADPLKRALVVVAISYYLSCQSAPIRISVSSSVTLPGPLSTMSVKPEIVVTVAPEAIVVEPSVGAE